MKTHRPRQSASQWASIIKQFDESGLGTRAFCKEHDLALATFSKWQRRIRIQGTGIKTPAFKPIKTVTPNSPASAAISDSSTITLSLGSHIVLTIQSGSHRHER